MASFKAKERLLRRYLLWKARPGRLRRSLAKAAGRSGMAEGVDTKATTIGSTFTVAAVQLRAKLFADPVEYAAEMHRWVAEARLAGAELVVFPEYNNLQLLGMLPGVEEMAAGVFGGASGAVNGRAAGRSPDPVAGGDSPDRPVDGDLPDPAAAGGSRDRAAGGYSAGDDRSSRPADISVAGVFRYIGPVAERIVHTTFSWLAARYRVHIAGGSFLLPDGERLVNRAMLFSPDGMLIGTHDKVHLMPVEHTWGIDAGADFPVFHTDLGPIATPVCMDATFSETFRILELKGARVAALPIADAAEYNRWLALRGIVPRVQESLLYGVKSALVGSVLGVRFTGRSGIFAPVALTPDGDGVLAEAADPEDAGLVTAEVDLAALERLRESYEHRDFNPSLHARYFPKVYERAPARTTEVCYHRAGSESNAPRGSGRAGGTHTPPGELGQRRSK